MECTTEAARLKDLKICKSKYLESTFLEEINQSGKNIIVGCIYRHRSMDGFKRI